MIAVHFLPDPSISPGVATVSVLSEYVALNVGASHGTTVPAQLVAPAFGDERRWFQEGRPLLCVSESDAGIATAERIGNALDAVFKNAPNGAQRRNKWLLHETLRAAGQPACRQSLCATEADVAEFFDSEKRSGASSVVLKPARYTPFKKHLDLRRAA